MMPRKSVPPICLAHRLPQWSLALFFASSTWSSQAVSHPRASIQCSNRNWCFRHGIFSEFLKTLIMSNSNNYFGRNIKTIVQLNNLQLTLHNPVYDDEKNMRVYLCERETQSRYNLDVFWQPITFEIVLLMWIQCNKLAWISYSDSPSNQDFLESAQTLDCKKS